MTTSFNFQALASRQGREFADECIRLATRVGFVVRDQRTEIQHEAGKLAHLVEDPPAGSDDPFATDAVLLRIAAIRRLLDETVLVAVSPHEGGNHVTE